MIAPSPLHCPLRISCCLKFRSEAGRPWHVLSLKLFCHFTIAVKDTFGGTVAIEIS